MTERVKPTTEAGIKRLAKQLNSERKMPHTEALDVAARQAGFSNYRHAQNAIKSPIDELEKEVREVLIRYDGGGEILDLVAAPDRSHWYAAVRYEGIVHGYVVISELQNDLTYRIKPISEEAAPFAIQAPTTLIDKLSPTNDENANDWRRACRDVAAGRDVTNPFASFTHKGELIPGSREAIEDAAERKAYEAGILARQSGVKLDEFPEGMTGMSQVLYMDGWLWANNQIAAEELLALETKPRTH